VFEIGTTLREARVRRKLTLQQAEDDTKIRVKYIQAMENEDFEVMPSPAYVKGFLRTYSGYLGLDSNVILQEYYSRFQPDEEHDVFGGASALRPHPHRRRNTLAFVAVVCLLVLALIYFLGLGSADNGKVTPPTVVSPTATPSTSPTATHSASPKPKPTALTLAVTTTSAASWVEVREGSPTGTTLFAQTVPQGVTKTFHVPVGTKCYLRLGVPDAMTVRVDGKKLATPAETLPTTYQVSTKGMVKV
jgi:cytoskeleton protein RodZ